MSTTSDTTTTPGSVLVSDAERDQAVRRVHEALGDGRIEFSEAERRTTAAYAAQYREELDLLVVDLPAATVSGPRPGLPTWASIREALVWRAHLVVWGQEADRPTAAQCRTATIVAAAAVVWFLLCAVLGALAVGA